MATAPKRSLRMRYGSTPLSRIVSQSVESCTAGHAVIHEHDLTASIGQIRCTNHAAAFHTAELHRLEIRNQHDFSAD